MCCAKLKSNGVEGGKLHNRYFMVNFWKLVFSIYDGQYNVKDN